MRAALARLLHAAHEDDTLADQRQEVRAVEASLPVGHMPSGMTCGGVPKAGECGFDCACH
jgi:hypothetical protein